VVRSVRPGVEKKDKLSDLELCTALILLWVARYLDFFNLAPSLPKYSYLDKGIPQKYEKYLKWKLIKWSTHPLSL